MSQLENDLNNEVEKLKESFNAGDIIKGLIILSGISAELVPQGGSQKSKVKSQK